MAMPVTVEKAVIKAVFIGAIKRYVIETSDGRLEYAETADEVGEIIKHFV